MHQGPSLADPYGDGTAGRRRPRGVAWTGRMATLTDTLPGSRRGCRPVAVLSAGLMAVFTAVTVSGHCW